MQPERRRRAEAGGAASGFLRSMNLIFGGVIEAFGVLSLLLLAVNRVWIRGLSQRTITIASTAIAVFAFCLLVAYLGCYQYCVVTLDPRGTVYFPLWNAGDLAKIVSDAGVEPRPQTSGAVTLSTRP